MVISSCNYHNLGMGAWNIKDRRNMREEFKEVLWKGILKARENQEMSSGLNLAMVTAEQTICGRTTGGRRLETPMVCLDSKDMYMDVMYGKLYIQTDIV